MPDVFIIGFVEEGLDQEAGVIINDKQLIFFLSLPLPHPFSLTLPLFPHAVSCVRIYHAFLPSTSKSQ